MLDALETQALAANQNLKAAAARVEQARGAGRRPAPRLGRAARGAAGAHDAVVVDVDGAVEPFGIRAQRDACAPRAVLGPQRRRDHDGMRAQALAAAGDEAERIGVAVEADGVVAQRQKGTELPARGRRGRCGRRGRRESGAAPDRQRASGDDGVQAQRRRMRGGDQAGRAAADDRHVECRCGATLAQRRVGGVGRKRADAAQQEHAPEHVAPRRLPPQQMPERRALDPREPARGRCDDRDLAADVVEQVELAREGAGAVIDAARQRQARMRQAAGGAVEHDVQRVAARAARA